MRIEVEKMLVEKKNDLFWKFGSFTFEIKRWLWLCVLFAVAFIPTDFGYVVVWYFDMNLVSLIVSLTSKVKIIFKYLLILVGL